MQTASVCMGVLIRHALRPSFPNTVHSIRMNTVCLVACTSKKALYPTTAEDLYRSPLFDGAKWFAKSRCNSWFILSAKHGLLAPNDMVEPYDKSLHQLDDSDRQAWAEQVYSKLSVSIEPSAKIVFLAGDKYRQYLQKYFDLEGRLTSAPLSELGIGSQVSWLQKLFSEDARVNDIDRFYRLVRRIANADIEGPRQLGDRKASAVPKRGVYFFLQTDEKRMSSPFENRIVRIGTHSVSLGSKATLWNRLRTHRGGEDGTGNHRGSIFRLHVGDALIRKAALQTEFPTWGIGQTATADIRNVERDLELEVSKVIAAMPVLWVGVGDESSPDSDRTYLERNLIALLSGPTGPIDLPSTNWLGKWSRRDAIGFSGLWNVNHVYEEYDPQALDVLERYVESAEGLAELVTDSLAPPGWRSRASKSKLLRQQMRLV